MPRQFEEYWKEYQRFLRATRRGSASRNQEDDQRPEKDRAGGFWPDTDERLEHHTLGDREPVPNVDYYDGVGR